MVALSGEAPEEGTAGAASGQALPRRPGEASLVWSLYTWFLISIILNLGALGAVCIGGVAALLGDRDRRVASRLLQWGFNSLTWLHPHYKVTVTGRDNLPHGGFVLCPNHQSYSDVVYLYELAFHFKWVVKQELFWVPPFGPAMLVAGYPAIRRGDGASAQRLMQRVKGYLDRGVPVLNFPEGSRSRSGVLQVFTKGPARMAVASQVPLVPIGLIGTGRLLPKGSPLYPARGHIAIHIGEPIPTAGMTAKHLRSLTEQLRQGVQAAQAVAQARVDAG